MKRVAIPAAMALLVVVAFIALAGYNRSGEPLVQLTLTERELLLTQYAGEGADRDPGVKLRFSYVPRGEPLDARNWLTDDRLRSIGFRLHVMPSAPEAADTYNRALRRLAWVAFEYDGQGWREIERRRQLTQPPLRHPAGGLLEPSRLVPVDAGPDGAALAARYPTGHLVLRASIDLGYLPPGQKGPIVYGSIRQLIPAAVHVPREFRDVITSLRAERNPPRYEVDIAVGRLGIPFVTGMRPR